jgi:hypothetical protein
MMAKRGTIEKRVALLILQAGWNGRDVLVVERFGFPVFMHSLEAEWAIRAAADEPETDILDRFGA